jgi:hypothetical protein
MNHAKGRATALEQTKQLAADQLRAIHDRGGYIPDDIKQEILL